MNKTFLSPSISLEANIQYQVSNIFRLEVIGVIEQSRIAKKLLGAELAAVVKKHTNLSVRVGTDTSTSPNAYVIPPRIDSNHPLVNEWRRRFGDNVDGMNAINFTNDNAFGSVDLETGKVYGIFTKMTSEIYITNGALNGAGNIKLTDAEVAALFLHEIGHIITYFLTLGQGFRTAVSLQTMVRESMRLSPGEERFKLIKTFEEKTDVTIRDKEKVANTESAEVLTTVVLSDIVESTRSQFGTTLYDMRSWETLSDQYAARLGCSADLATALDKLYGIYDPMYFRGTFKYLMVEIVKVILSIFVIGAVVMTLNVVGIMLTFMVLSASPHNREYDNPYERIVKLRSELVSQAKDTQLTKERTKSLLDDVNVIDGILKDVKDRHSFFEKLWLVVSPTTRRQVKMSKEIQELEKLVNNDLFLSAARLNHLN